MKWDEMRALGSEIATKTCKMCGYSNTILRCRACREPLCMACYQRFLPPDHQHRMGMCKDCVAEKELVSE